MSQRLQGKTAFITGAGQGIGRAISEAFVREGARVIASDINPATLEELSAIGDIETVILDVTDASAIADCATRFDGTNVLVNCSEMVAHGSVLDCTEADWSRSFDLNVTAIYHMIQAFLPAMRAQGSGSIINIASVCSSLRGAATTTRPARPLSIANPWAGSARWRKLPPSPRCSPVMRRHL